MTERPGRGPDPSDLLDSLARVSFTVAGLLTRTAAEHDLSLTQLRVIAVLRDREPTMAQLADHLGLGRSSVSGLVDRAVDRGLVRRVASAEDGRAVRVTLTPDGRGLARELGRVVDARVAPMTDRLGPADRTRLDSLLRRLLA